MAQLKLIKEEPTEEEYNLNLLILTSKIIELCILHKDINDKSKQIIYYKNQLKDILSIKIERKSVVNVKQLSGTLEFKGELTYKTYIKYKETIESMITSDNINIMIIGLSLLEGLITKVFENVSLVKKNINSKIYYSEPQLYKDIHSLHTFILDTEISEVVKKKLNRIIKKIETNEKYNIF